MMERRFDMTDFEQSLRDHADQFIMVPSKKVWNGIYNNLHPGSPWPSISVALILLFSLIGIGHLNNTPKGKITNNTASVQIQKIIVSNNQISNKSSINNINFYPDLNSPSAENQSIKSSDKSIAGSLISDFVEKPIFSENEETTKSNSSPDIVLVSTAEKPAQLNQNNNDEKGNLIQINSSSNNNSDKNNPSVIVTNSIENNSVGQDLSQQNLTTVINRNDLKTDVSKPEIVSNNIAGIVRNDELNLVINNQLNHLSNGGSLNSAKIEAPEIHSGKNNEGQTQKTDVPITKENITLKNKLIHILRKRNPNIHWTYFVTPNVSTVSFSGRPLPSSANRNFSSIIVQSNRPGGNMLYNARLDYSVGIEMAYRLSEKWQFITGANFTQAGYNIISNEVHPTFAFLMLKDKSSGLVYAASYLTHYGNGQSRDQTLLMNKSAQASIPIGLRYTLWNNKNVQVGLASAIEPSVVLKSNAYIISSNGEYYVNDPDLTRTFNFSGNFSPYITLGSKKIRWQIGPDFRYQLFSTYRNIYPVHEHLINYGIKIGISIFK